MSAPGSDRGAGVRASEVEGEQWVNLPDLLDELDRWRQAFGSEGSPDAVFAAAILGHVCDHITAMFSESNLLTP